MLASSGKWEGRDRRRLETSEAGSREREKRELAVEGRAKSSRQPRLLVRRSSLDQ